MDMNNEKQSGSGKSGRIREIDVKKIAAFKIDGPIPQDLSITSGKVYEVDSWSRFVGQDVWVKTERPDDDPERIFVFEFTNDEENPQELALDLDDEAITFFDKNKKVLGG